MANLDEEQSGVYGGANNSPPNGNQAPIINRDQIIPSNGAAKVLAATVPSAAVSNAKVATVEDRINARIANLDEQHRLIVQYAKIAQTKDKNSHIPREIFDDFIKYREKHIHIFRDAAALALQPNAGNLEPKDGQVKAVLDNKEKTMNSLVYEDVLKAHRARSKGTDAQVESQVQAGWTAVKEELPSKGFMENITGNITTPGLIGAGIGLMGGLLFAGGSGIMGIVMAVALAIGGMWAGNKFSEMRSENASAAPTPGEKKKEVKAVDGKGATVAPPAVAPTTDIVNRKNFAQLGSASAANDQPPSPGAIPAQPASPAAVPSPVR